MHWLMLGRKTKQTRTAVTRRARRGLRSARSRGKPLLPFLIALPFHLCSSSASAPPPLRPPFLFLLLLCGQRKDARRCAVFHRPVAAMWRRKDEKRRVSLFLSRADIWRKELCLSPPRLPTSAYTVWSTAASFWVAFSALHLCLPVKLSSSISLRASVCSNGNWRTCRYWFSILLVFATYASKLHLGLSCWCLRCFFFVLSMPCHRTRRKLLFSSFSWSCRRRHKRQCGPPYGERKERRSGGAQATALYRRVQQCAWVRVRGGGE
ncbi:hypothetical protein ABB37_09338 [Leptomonas pyrrhocoris]|uniref:Uncharacterized protein n=1 Tax=Leptomonas pyrrhocoris TaxID=157538 RepID=A0A0M9FRB5_LEPPY|nr:hypothetical protein ABB37_09338 [Leptomonas pyrrhocoris]KPA74359.1 hypothetical protein ABB37_09338 [Leptomonas pyrrhocoris]|eukprot:XP_015652798.1 hypothetical protein ABB37_09338 [Leptomonas pyrrhocoris]